MITPTPDSAHRAIASIASGRGGSSMPTSPSSVIPDGSPDCTARDDPSPRAVASASTRRPSPAMRDASSNARSASMATSPSPSPGPRSSAHIAITRSGAPLRKTTGSPPSPTVWIVAAYCRSDSNGTSSTSGCASSVRSRDTPARAAATSSATSVGSP
ncbi:MAG: hypothetical protein EA379_07480 [Phycisphaerales bacterium]|nr:MAG: hypothetical protein EA379_07480 [Phycisphaerales bacterium]